MTTTLLDRIVNKVSPLKRRVARKKIEIAAQILDMLEQRGWTQRELAQKMGKKEAYISRLLRGGSNPTLSTLCAIEDAFGDDVFVAPNYFHTAFQLSQRIEIQYVDLDMTKVHAIEVNATQSGIGKNLFHTRKNFNAVAVETSKRYLPKLATDLQGAMHGKEEFFTIPQA